MLVSSDLLLKVRTLISQLPTVHTFIYVKNSTASTESVINSFLYLIQFKVELYLLISDIIEIIINFSQTFIKI